MPYPLEHAARMLDPKQFDEFKRKNIAKGIDVILGIKNGRSTIQSYRFDSSVFTEDKAREWMQSHGLKYIAFEKATGKMQGFISLVAKVQAFSNDDIMKLIPNDALLSIKEKDAHPYFQAYSVCHEGISTPRLLGETSYPIHWTKKAVQSLKNIVLKGVKFFVGHNEDNSTENRQSLGEIVADTQQEIDGVLHHIVVGYFPDKAKVEAMDICSQESEWNFFEAAGNWFADTVHKVTGIALSNSKEDIPAFRGAIRLGMVQAFDEIDKKRKVRAMSDIDFSVISLGELKRIVTERGLAPSELFTIDHIKGDRVFGKEFDTIKTLTDEKKKAEEKIKELTDEKDKLDKSSKASTAKSRFEKLVDESKDMTDKMKTYVKKGFNESISDLSDEGLKKHIETKIADYQSVAEVLGHKEELPKQGESNNKSTEGDATKAASNPLLEEDLDINP